MPCLPGDSRPKALTAKQAARPSTKVKAKAKTKAAALPNPLDAAVGGRDEEAGKKAPTATWILLVRFFYFLIVVLLVISSSGCYFLFVFAP
jgi:hypothetical protein